MKKLNRSLALALGLAVTGPIGCMPPPAVPPRIPSMEYTSKLKEQINQGNPEYRNAMVRGRNYDFPVNSASLSPEARARLHLAATEAAPLPQDSASALEQAAVPPAISPETQTAPGFHMVPSSQPNLRDYTGPLSLGDPGLTASLWRENGNANALFRDDRAFQVMDLITIQVIENATAKNKADTDVKRESSISAALNNFFGIEDNFSQPNLSALINANASSEHKGEGETKREGNLRGTISAMVVEVLPSGVLRVEGEKIINVNSEDQVMVLSGLVRPEDVTSANEVSSAKVANMRIDYYGKGTVGNVQKGGAFMNLFNAFWPF